MLYPQEDPTDLADQKRSIQHAACCSVELAVSPESVAHTSTKWPNSTTRCTPTDPSYLLWLVLLLQRCVHAHYILYFRELAPCISLAQHRQEYHNYWIMIRPLSCVTTCPLVFATMPVGISLCCWYWPGGVDEVQ
jgi:hypothetical protein